MERSTSYNVEVYVFSPRFEFWKCYGTVQVRAREVATKTRQQPLSITLDKLLDVWWETVESGGRESALHSILLGFRPMEAVSDFVCNSPHQRSSKRAVLLVQSYRRCSLAFCLTF